MVESLQAELEFTPEHKGKVAITTIAPYFIRTGFLDGCSSTSPWLVPDMEPNYAAQRIMQAILAEQSILVMPRSIYWFSALRM